MGCKGILMPTDPPSSPRYKHEIESLKNTTSELETQLKNAGVELLQLKQGNEALQHEMAEREEKEKTLTSTTAELEAKVQHQKAQLKKLRKAEQALEEEKKGMEACGPVHVCGSL